MPELDTPSRTRTPMNTSVAQWVLVSWVLYTLCLPRQGEPHSLDNTSQQPILLCWGDKPQFLWCMPSRTQRYRSCYSTPKGMLLPHSPGYFLY